MSKLFDMELRREQNEPEALRKVQQQAHQQEAFDAEAALHVELLTQTDAKLDRINARLDRFCGELNQWSQRVEQVEHHSRDRHAVHEHRRSPAAAFLLLIAGALGGAYYTTWRNGAAMPMAPWQAIGESAALPATLPADERAPLLEVTQGQQPVEVEPQPPALQVADQPASQPPPARPEPAMAPDPAAVPEMAAASPQPATVLQPEAVPAPVPVPVPVQVQQTVPETTVHVSRDAEVVEPAFTSSGHGRIRM